MYVYLVMARKTKWTKTSAQQLVLLSHLIRREICRSGDYRNTEKVVSRLFFVCRCSCTWNNTWKLHLIYLDRVFTCRICIDTYRPQKLMIDRYCPSGGQGQDDIIAMFKFPFCLQPILSSSHTQLSFIHMNDSISLIRKIIMENRKKMELL